MNIVIASRQRTKTINARLLRQIVSALLAELEIKEAELGINLIAVPEMTVVNETFLQHEGSTDVITFDHRNCELRVANCELKIHGELFICVDDGDHAGETIRHELAVGDCPLYCPRHFTSARPR